MARKYGGKYSPGAAAQPVGPVADTRRSRVGARANLLFVLPFPFLVSAFRSDPVGLALNLGCFGALMLAAWLTREGITAQEAFEARKVARKPAIPRKIFASVLTGTGLALAGLGDGSLTSAVVFGGLGGLLHFGAFGPDPLRDKGIGGAEGADRVQSERVDRAVQEAEAHLAAMTGAIARAGDRELSGRVEEFKRTARKMFRAIEDDPRDLGKARRFMGVYLLGARDATVKFADLFARNRDPQARADYLALLGDLEANYASKTDTLLLDDRTDLDVEIEVLRERLAREMPVS
ncbi:hypothetical protein DKT77_12170 [Meridianimarinicoccus roseus]|uniref:5-bromo-4-chloroindolyl phosphate hydrolysis protein n=1 Tax=Meridianimarinicoccus roseus TaxID=2072018 RepID=A0A2V2LAR0_9RHOB|nr:5-bromo-4-chloroindolyl phosphate hydrolysis family protein [Meridianimarinicoccus roseus]PWR02302.1 hypothetical protein DKT77_12170 [Meridianimarinicoccus roseus]